MSTKQLEQTANSIREDIITMLTEAGSGHSAGPLGMADIFTALYFEVMNHRPKEPGWPERDRLILSNGHIVPVRYATMARAGYFPRKELQTLRKFGSRLQGHPERTKLPGLETTSGPLGCGLSQALGMALALRLDGNYDSHIYCTMGDGELDEGNVWEAAMFGGKQQLANVTVIIDRNNIQIDGPTEVVMPLEDLHAKWRAFGWEVLEMDGHNMTEIIATLQQARDHARPVAVIAHTIPGKGVGYMEYDYRWHGMPPGLQDVPGEPAKADQARVALHDLRTLGGRIRSEHE